ncbi:hypothetical protein GCM10023187_09650 [Nibrella viscosa]|uniref:Uncharacterized protein n=1 Tax=Nibrella viscosa TaxID=1084524 RepID=A0ABP8K010_9BACT
MYVFDGSGKRYLTYLRQADPSPTTKKEKKKKPFYHYQKVERDQPAVSDSIRPAPFPVIRGEYNLKPGAGKGYFVAM